MKNKKSVAKKVVIINGKSIIKKSMMDPYDPGKPGFTPKYPLKKESNDDKK